MEASAKHQYFLERLEYGCSGMLNGTIYLIEIWMESHRNKSFDQKISFTRIAWVRVLYEIKTITLCLGMENGFSDIGYILFLINTHLLYILDRNAWW